MIEASLVYIHSDRTSSRFVGCGALVEGPFVVTCRHVWDQARKAAGDGLVLVRFPPPQGKGEPVFAEAILADACDLDGNQPDLVILRAEVPPANAALSVARARVAEIGPAAAIAGLVGRDARDRHAVQDTIIRGTIEAYINSEGLCQFTGVDGRRYWSDRGSSGSPLGLADGTALAGILCLSETGARPGEAELHEAFVFPATTIHACLRAHVGRTAAEARDIDAAKMPGILNLLGASELSLDDLRRRLDAYFDNVEALANEIAISESAEVAMPFRDGAAASLASARALSAKFEPVAAMAVLDEALAEEARINGKLLLLLIEKATQQQLLLDHQGAIACLTVITVLDPNLFRQWISLGDAQRRTGNLKAALDAYRGSLGAASRADDQSDLAIAHQRVGAVLLAMGDLSGALAEARASFEITRQLAQQDTNRADFQRELAVAHNSVGIILVCLGDFHGAMQEFDSGLAVIRHLCTLDPGQPRWQHDLSISYERIGGVLLRLNDLPAALEAFQAGAAIRQSLSANDPGNAEWQRELGVSYHKVGETHHAQALVDAKAEDRSQHAQQNLADALACFRAALSAFEPLARRDPDNAELQRDVSAAHISVGGILLLQGDPAGALAAYRDDLTIVERLIDTDPDRADWQRDLLVSCERMASVNPDGRRGWITRALGIATRLAERGRLDPVDAWIIPDLQARLDALPPDPAPGPTAPPH